MKTIGEKYRLRHRPKNRFGSAYQPEKPYVGFEVEVEGVPNLLVSNEIDHHDTDATSRKAEWIIKTDGSLRNNGAEIVTNILDIEEAPRVFSEILEALRGDEYDFSTRTSIHVHVNVIDMSPVQLKAFLYLYLLVEPLLYKFVARHRQDNIYCNRLSETYNRLPSETNWSKYTGLNLCPVSSLGTVEFRQLEGTSDIQKFTTWVNIIGDLYRAAYRVTEDFDSLFQEIAGLNTDSAYQQFLEQVLPTSATDLLHHSGVADLHAELYPAVAYVKAQKVSQFEVFTKRVGILPVHLPVPNPFQGLWIQRVPEEQPAELAPLEEPVALPMRQRYASGLLESWSRVSRRTGIPLEQLREVIQAERLAGRPIPRPPRVPREHF